MNEAVRSLEAEIAYEDKINDAIYRFNVKPQRGISVLCSAFNVDCTPKNIAHLMHTVNGLEGMKIGDYLSRPENAEILKEYYSQINLKKPLLNELRKAIG